MDVDPRLIRLATQLGRLVRAYGREATEGGHAAAALGDAFGRGLVEEIPGRVEVALPIHLNGYMGDEEFGLSCDHGIHLEFYADGVCATGIADFPAYREGDGVDLRQAFLRLALGFDKDLQVDVYNTDGRLSLSRSLAGELPPLKDD